MKVKAVKDLIANYLQNGCKKNAERFLYVDEPLYI